MSGERINGTGIQLGEKNIFGSTDWYDLTPLGSCLEGIDSVQHYLNELSNNVMSEDKREEWRNHIEEKFCKAGELMGIQIPESERESLIQQYREIARKRMDLLTKLPDVY